jgi:sulfate-transporting ATPase
VITFLQFALLGIGTGALYGFSAQGLVVVYRGTGVLNFAHGAIGIAAAYFEWELQANDGWSYPAATVAAIALAALFGAAFHLVVMRRLRQAAPLVRVVATLGVLIGLEGVATVRYGSNVQPVHSQLPVDIWHLGSRIYLTSDKVYLLIIAVVITTALWAFYKYSMFGLATSAVAENDRAAGALGVSRDRIATVNWALGSGLAALAAILLAPISSLSVSAMTNMLLPTMAAALVGRFTSFGLTLAGGIAIGVIETVINYYASTWGNPGIGIGTSVPFVIVILILVFRGRSLPLRDFFLQRQANVGTGRVRWATVTVAVALAIVLLSNIPAAWDDAFAFTFGTALILLSVNVLIGYAGQISLAQYAIGAAGVWVAAVLVAEHGWPFWAAVLAGMAASVPLGALFALPAVRTRGISLAIVTLGLGAVLENIFFANSKYMGGLAGYVVGNTHLFGWDINDVTHPARWASVCLVAFTLAAIAVANLRRGRTGRRLLAVRGNERAAAALGISLRADKVYAFCLAAAIATLGSVFLNFNTQAVLLSGLSNSQSITLAGIAVIGGVGYLMGPLVGATFAVGSVGTQLVDSLFNSTVASWLQAFSGLILLTLILRQPDGLAVGQMEHGHWLVEHVFSRIPVPRPKWAARGTDGARGAGLSQAEHGKVAPLVLEVSGVTVRYGAVVACQDVSLSVTPGKILGLIGPNGAGKTTLIDAITGFTPVSGGKIALDGHDITRASTVHRSRAGISRSFQSLELFEDMTVLDNLRIAFETRSRAAYLTDLVLPVSPPLPPEVVAAIRECRLEDRLDRRVSDLAYGERRLVAMARAVATHPSVLLLDECAAGLSEHETRELGHVIRRLASDWGIGVMVIEHDVNWVMSLCDQVIVLDFGQKIADGPPDAVRNDPDVISAYLGEPTEATTVSEPPAEASTVIREASQ